MPRKLDTIRDRNNLNEVFAVDGPGPGNASHTYSIRGGGKTITIQFQCGPREEPDSTPGVLDVDLLEIVRDRLIGFQKGDFACRENAIALTHIEDALLWMDRRVRDRANRNVLGTNQK